VTFSSPFTYEYQFPSFLHLLRCCIMLRYKKTHKMRWRNIRRIFGEHDVNSRVELLDTITSQFAKKKSWGGEKCLRCFEEFSAESADIKSHVEFLRKVSRRSLRTVHARCCHGGNKKYLLTQFELNSTHQWIGRKSWAKRKGMKTLVTNFAARFSVRERVIFNFG
jgi:hypothetical protein